MKKYISIIFILLTVSFLSAEESIFCFSAAFSTGAALSTSTEDAALKKQIGNTIPVNFGTAFYLNLNPANQICFFAGSDLFFNINSKSHQFYTQFSVSIPFGVKIYPDLKGFCISAACSPGFRNDYIKTSDMNKMTVQKSCWGNGFRLSIEYDFSRNSKQKNYPSIGICWISTPRGNYNWDNLITAFISASL